MSESTSQATATASTPYTLGAFVWHEFVSADVPTAEKFYSQLFGWKFSSMPSDGHDYRLISVGDKMIGGFFHMAGVPSGWMGYVSVPDVDAAAATTVAAGGQISKAPTDIPEVGRFAVAVDPQGAVFTLFRSINGDPPGRAEQGNAEICWDSLSSTDLEASKAFYGKVVGWTAHGNPNEPSGFVFNMGEAMEASANATPPGVQAHWMVYIMVADLAAARERAKSLGAEVLMSEIDIPFGTFAVLRDPVGGVFAAFQPRMDG